ncbi:MAG: hypothetical protein ABIP61_01080, partial [Burkholderiaceae bacterium]
LLLTACGGGGGGGAPGTVPSTLSFSLSSGFKSRIQSGATDNFNVTGTCIGNASIATGASALATPRFENVAGSIASPQTSTLHINFCPAGLGLASGTSTGNTYYDGTSYVPIGLHVDNGEYSVYVPSLASALPVKVMGGDSGDIVTLTTYKDATKLEVTGKRVLSYEINDDTAATVFLDMFTRSYNVGGTLLSTEQTRYRMAENGNLTMVSINVTSVSPKQFSLVYTPK